MCLSLYANEGCESKTKDFVYNTCTHVNFRSCFSGKKVCIIHTGKYGSSFLAIFSIQFVIIDCRLVLEMTLLESLPYTCA